MSANTIHAWRCDGEDFEDDAALAGHLAARIGAGDEVIRFTRAGCMFRLTYEDERVPPPAGQSGQGRTYVVELMTNSPNCTGGNLFTSEWPEGYSQQAGSPAAGDTADEARVAEGTSGDCLRILTTISGVM